MISLFLLSIETEAPSWNLLFLSCDIWIFIFFCYAVDVELQRADVTLSCVVPLKVNVRQ